jgi:intracellular multiplication protein IcmK
MKFFNLKRLIFFVIILLIAGDVSLLFAADGNVTENQELQQLQQKQWQELQRLGGGATPTASQPVAAPIAQAAPPAFAQAPAAPPLLSPQQAPQPPQALPQQLAQASLPPPTDQPQNGSDQELNGSAFNAMTQSVLPMTPEQIMRLRQLFSSSQQAAAASPTTPPRPTATSQFVNLAPGTTPPVIRLAQGFVTSLVFVDSTGAPWPIQAYDIGNPGAFNIQWNKKDNTLMIQALTLYTYGNLAVRLQGLVTPVMLTLTPGQKAVDYRVDLRVQGVGPNAAPTPSSDGLPGVANSDLLGVLDGLPPAGSKMLEVSGGEAQAWTLGEKLYVRTRLVILSPGWLATMSSADGMHAYEMQKAPMLLVSRNGKAVQLKIEGL